MLTIEALKNLGVNTKDGLDRCLNNETFYFNLITRTMKDDSIAKLKNVIDAGDLDTAFQIAHNLKGSLGNLGLTPIYEPICEITELLRKREQIDYSPYLDRIIERKKEIEALCD